MKIAWFSCGITSAVACKLAVDQYDNVEIFYINIASAHDDNKRFIEDCEKWIGKKINVVTNKKGYKDQFDVIRKTKYINGPHGARCTLELKKQVRRDIEQDLMPDNQIFGFEFAKNEINRAIRFKEQNPHTNPLYPLIENKLTKNECAAILQTAGIELPVMYQMGYENNNCIGCVKGGKGYWNKIREDFPEVFKEMANIEREIGATCLKDDNGRIYLDELDPSDGYTPNPIIPACGMFCQVEFAHIMDKRVDEIINQKISINDV